MPDGSLIGAQASSFCDEAQGLVAPAEARRLLLAGAMPVDGPRRSGWR